VAKHGACSKELIPNKIFPIFWLEDSLRFSMGCFDLSSFFLLRKKEGSSAASSSSSKVPKTEPLSPIADALDFAYASDIAKDNSCKPGHVIELLF
jgi:hypothetical protein